MPIYTNIYFIQKGKNTPITHKKVKHSAAHYNKHLYTIDFEYKVN